MSKPFLSVVIPTHRRNAYLRKAIESVLAQEEVEKEIIVVDNGPSESTRALCGEYPVTYVRQDPSGPSAARNLGVLYAKGGLLAFLDDDDLWAPGSLKVRLDEWARGPRNTLVVGRVRRFVTAGDDEIRFLDSMEDSRHLLVLGASLMTRDSFLEAGGFDESISAHEDTDLWIRVKSSGSRISYIPEICLHYRRHEGNATAQWDEHNSHITGVLRKHLEKKRHSLDLNRSTVHLSKPC
jgi:glycosyltransferase involved in cell wall biosynthesis